MIAEPHHTDLEQAGDTGVSMETPCDESTALHYSLEGRFRPNGPISVIPIRDASFTVGRKPDNSLSLSDSTVSSHHAVIDQVSGFLFLRDEGSTNGTFVNGRRIEAPQRVVDGDLIQFGAAVMRVTASTGQTTGATEASDVSDDALALMQFGRIMQRKDVHPHLQPIVEIVSERVIAFEALARSQYAGLKTAESLFKAASQLNAEVALSQMSRMAGMWVAERLPADTILFVNTHPNEIADDGLMPSLRKLRERWPNRPLVVEIHEATVTDMARLREIKHGLTNLGMSLAFDDFGAGQARLKELVDVRPDYVKFDIALLENAADVAHPQHRLTKALVQMTRDLGIIALAEGVETIEQGQFCKDAGFTLAQGFLYGRPESAKKWIDGTDMDVVESEDRHD